VFFQKKADTMNEMLQSKSNIAWFKLSELVMRRERDRAVSVFRLLSHSIADKAFVALLEGELLHVFGDIRAKDACYRAIDLYKSQCNYEKVLLAYSYIFEWWPEEAECIERIYTLCATQSSEVLWQIGMRLVVRWYIKLRRWDCISSMIELEECDSRARNVWLKRAVVYGTIYQEERSINAVLLERYSLELAQYYIYKAPQQESRFATQLFTLLSSFDQDLCQRAQNVLPG
jgi:hypothetical protein